MLSNTRVWNKNMHSAFTDLVEWNGKIYLSFREARTHVPKDSTGYGRIRVLVSSNGDLWDEFALISEVEHDLRDPKLIVTPDNKLMLLCGYSKLIDGQLKKQGTQVAFLEKDNAFSKLQPINHNLNHETWIWRMIWNNNIGYGIGYMEGFKAALLRTVDGLNWTLVVELDLEGTVTEASLLIADNTLKTILRRDGLTSLIGESVYPFNEWKWTDMFLRFESPIILQLENGRSIIAGRCVFQNSVETSVYELSKNNEIKKIVTLNTIASGDSSYPGIVILKNGKEVIVSYYSGTYHNASIYVAKIRIDK